MNDTYSKSISYKGFTFRIGDEKLIYGTSKVLSYYDVSPLEWTPEEAQQSTTHFRGALLTLFGPPLQSSSVSDEAIVYCIEVVDPYEKIWILTAYEGPSGSAIGGRFFHRDGITREENKPVAELLRELIRKTYPSDFRSVVYDEDTDNTFEYGIENGNYFYKEQRGNQL